MQLGRSKEIIFIHWLNDHCDREGSHLGQNRAAPNPRVPARSPGLAPRALTRPPTGPITRGKTNKGSYYTLLMKDTRGEGGKAGHHRNKRALTDSPPSLPLVPSHPHLHPKSPHQPARLPTPPNQPLPPHACLRARGIVEVRDSRGSARVGRGRGLRGPLIE